MASIVVAEDDDDLRALTVRILRRGGYDVVAAPDGAEALRAVRADPPHAVVSDIDMPVMSGVDLCRALRADPGTGALPVLLVSGSIVDGDPRPTEAQATAFLKKPFRPGDLLDCVRLLLTDGHRAGGAPREMP